MKSIFAWIEIAKQLSFAGMNILRTGSPVGLYFALEKIKRELIQDIDKTSLNKLKRMIVPIQKAIEERKKIPVKEHGALLKLVTDKISTDSKITQAMIDLEKEYNEKYPHPVNPEGTYHQYFKTFSVNLRVVIESSFFEADDLPINESLNAMDSSLKSLTVLSSEEREELKVLFESFKKSLLTKQMALILQSGAELLLKVDSVQKVYWIQLNKQVPVDYIG